jgi:hypothetical protein
MLGLPFYAVKQRETVGPSMLRPYGSFVSTTRAFPEKPTHRSPLAALGEACWLARLPVS